MCLIHAKDTESIILLKIENTSRSAESDEDAEIYSDVQCMSVAK